jgi:hypothetical protein
MKILLLKVFISKISIVDVMEEYLCDFTSFRKFINFDVRCEVHQILDQFKHRILSTTKFGLHPFKIIELKDIHGEV